MTTIRFGALVQRVDQKRPGADLPLLSVSQTRGVLRRDELSDSPPRAESLDHYKTCQPGDIVFNKMSVRAGAMGEAREAGYITYHYEVMRPRPSVDPRFVVYLMKSGWFTGEMIRRERGIAAGDESGAVRTTEVPFRVLKTIHVPLIPPSEQRAIADFLDRETAQIDAFIAKNEQLITLLTERRAAVVAQAVTKGLNRDVTTEDSGIEWIGQVPAHWAIQRLTTTVATTRNGTWGDEADGGDDDIRCVRVADFDRPSQRTHDAARTLRKVTKSERRGRVLKNGDLLLEKSGGGEKSPVGYVVLYAKDEPAVCSNFVARVQLAPDMDSRFWTYVHGAMYRLRITERSLKQSTGIQNLDQAAYFNELVPVPPLDEQQEIANSLERRTAEIDEAIDAAQRASDLARERRAALISAAVTGKIDVGVSA